MKESKEELISVVVPIYNVENYLEQCIESILNQSYQNIEVILINDGSQDDSGKIADEKAKQDARIKVIHQKNAGVSTARNRGIGEAKGKYICFVDADDYLAKEYLSYFYNLIEENQADMVLTPFPKKINQTTVIRQEEETKDRIEIWDGQRAAQEMLYYNVVISSWNKMVSKKLIDTYQIRFRTQLAYGEGFNFILDCFQRANQVVVGHKKYYYYRVDNANSAMTKFSIKLVEGSIEAQKEIQNNLVHPTKELLQACKYANWHTYCDCFNTMIGAKASKKYQETYKELKKVCKKDALCTIKAPIPKKEKIKGILYFVNPYIASKIINHFRLRKFTV